MTLREDWIVLYGGPTAVPNAFPQETAFMIGVDAAAQNLSFLLSSGAIQIQDLLTAATDTSSPNTFLPLVTGWLTKLKAAGSLPAPIPPVPAAAPNVQDAAHLLANSATKWSTSSPPRPAQSRFRRERS